MTRFQTTKLTTEQFNLKFVKYVLALRDALALTDSNKQLMALSWVAEKCLIEHPALDITKGIDLPFKNAMGFYLNELDANLRDIAEKTFHTCMSNPQIFAMERDKIYSEVLNENEPSHELQVV